MSIVKSKGVSETEKLLSELCDQTFLNLWSYPNLYKSDGKEICDVLAVFQDHVFLFFDRESRKFDDPHKNLEVQWARWKKEVIDKQIATAEGAKRYLLSGNNKIFLDQSCKTPFPIPIPLNPKVHKIIVAHGAKEACKKYSKNNVSGSLAIGYSDESRSETLPFLVSLNKADPVHIFDSNNLETILRELDTVYDFTAYIIEKEAAIKRLNLLYYCGEEDLLAYYFRNYDKESNKYKIATGDSNGIFIHEGEWESFVKLSQYQLRTEQNSKFQIWDSLIQTTCENAFAGTVKGNGNVFNGRSAIFEMAMEPRFMRRVLSQRIIASIQAFPNITGIARNLSFMPSFFEKKGYVFLQVKHPHITDYENEYRPRRQAMLEIACGAAKNKFPHLEKIIGIAIDAPKFSESNSEDFLLLECKEWSEEDRIYYEEQNNGPKFFQTQAMTYEINAAQDFPLNIEAEKTKKVFKNERCPCKSGKKYKRCCGKD
ncbi:MAG: hypothetical protein EOO15_00835 [Chitinophagaceae bacterium]|nr:MAG: hypothetical protein EOO15_00835 [Chitinophagaceae bacterium]